MVSESYKRIKQIANDKIEKYGSAIKEHENSYGNPMLYIFSFIIFLLIIINLF